MKLRRLLLVTLLTLPVVAASAFASPLARGEEYIRPIRYLGPVPPPLNYVSPASVPTPASSEGIGPGSQIVIARPDGAFICTANFIWTSTKTTTTKKGNGKGKGSAKKSTTTTETKTYLGAAGHCFIPQDDPLTADNEERSSTHGPDADYNPALSSTSVCVANCEFGDQTGPIFGDFVQLGPLAYARQNRAGDQLGEDFGIVEIQPENASLIRPDMPVWGGPTGVEDVTLGGGVCVYGNGVGVGEIFLTKARAGIGRGVSEDERNWIADLPSAQGDSGSALVTCDPNAEGIDGRGAAGILTHIAPGQAAIVGTTTRQAVRMTLDDAGIPLNVMLADGTTTTPEPAPEYPPPPPPPPTPPPDGTIGVGQEYTWNAGPFTRVAPPETVLFGESCDNVQDADDHCDYEFVEVNPPPGGAQLSVDIVSDDPSADFDLYVFGPDGLEVDHSANPANPEGISKKVTLAGTYTIAVNPYLTAEASYTGTAKLEPPPPPPPPPPTLQGDGHIYQATLVDPFVLTNFVAPNAVNTQVVPGTLVDLSVRSLHSNDPNVNLSIDANGVANFTAIHQVTRDGQVVFGPFDAAPDTDGAAFQTTSTWDVPIDAAPGTYVFEAYVTVGGQTYQAATLTFEIVG